MKEQEGRDRGLYLLFVILLVYVVAFSGVAIWRFENFLYSDSGDLLLFEQVVHNTGHGRPFYNNFSNQSHFGDHNSLMLGVLAPFSLIMPSPYVLYIFTVLCIAVSAIPVYLLSRESFKNSRYALLLTCAYLMMPALLGQVYLSFHEMNLVLPFLTFTFYFFARERFVPFVTMFTLGLLVKEDVALTLFMFAPYAAIKRRSPRWWLTPAILAPAWFFLSIKLIIPHFNKNDAYTMGVWSFGNIGSSLSEIVVNTITRPLRTMEILLRPENFRYLFVLLLPAGLVLPFLSPEIIFIFPSVVLNMLAGSQRFRFITCIVGSDTLYFPRHMSLMASVFIFLALMYAIRMLAARYSVRCKNLTLILLLAILATTLYNSRFIFSRYFYTLEEQTARYSPSPQAVKKMLALIPREATVKSGITIASHLYDRKEAYYPVSSPKDSDYFIITTVDGGQLDFSQTAQIAYAYRLLASDENISLYVRK